MQKNTIPKQDNRKIKDDLQDKRSRYQYLTSSHSLPSPHFSLGTFFNSADFLKHYTPLLASRA